MNPSARPIIAVGDLVWDVLVKPDRLLLPGGDTTGRIALAPQPWTLYPIMGLLAAGSGMATPSLTSLISRRVAPQAQGATLGGTQALNSLTMVLGPLLAGALFDVLGLQAPYFVGGLLVAGALVLIGIAVRASAPAVVSTGMPSLSPEVE